MDLATAVSGERPRQVRQEDPLPRLLRHPQEQVVFGHAGVVDQDIELPVRVERPFTAASMEETCVRSTGTAVAFPPPEDVTDDPCERLGRPRAATTLAPLPQAAATASPILARRR